ncbi:helix-turn-helix domain-containing protein [Leptospira neocaledonica]|uniref:HTH araC/xylS-type domain-containing protein n=1 Tax=Leptospira neocaledonica TaxID=2023192 RepID=A0A2M9ZWM8_9LEPT|nr:helix-turn-helix domain-containing protein [Leptospira neocaledonica]PJZ76457.1 hypothetical protein CH365_13820 [Leptospira neocaledonica]
MGFLYHFTFFSSCLAFFCAIAQIGHSKPSEKRSIVAWEFFIVGSFLIHYPYVHSPLFVKFPYLYSFHLPILLWLGPLLSRSLLLFMEEDIPKYLSSPLHYLPGLISIFLYLPLFLESPEEKIRIAQNYIRPFPYNWGPFISILHLGIYIILTIRFLFRDFRFRKFLETKSLRIVILLLLGSCLPALGGVLISFGNVDVGYFVTYFFLSLLIPCILILQLRYPTLFEDVKQIIREERKYKTSQLGKLSLEQIRADLKELFEIKKIYLDDQISLSSVSEELKISKHQLSEYMNTQENRSFSEFVNEFRLDHSILLMKEKSDWPVLKIAFESGFQSKSAFHDAFKKRFKLSPSEYKRKKISV